jgi:hypothetical protein
VEDSEWKTRNCRGVLIEKIYLAVLAAEDMLRRVGTNEDIPFPNKKFKPTSAFGPPTSHGNIKSTFRKWSYIRQQWFFVSASNTRACMHWGVVLEDLMQARPNPRTLESQSECDQRYPLRRTNRMPRTDPLLLGAIMRARIHARLDARLMMLTPCKDLRHSNTSR